MHISLSTCLLVKLYKKGQNYHLFYILPSILALRASYRLSVGCRPSLRRILARWVFTLDSVLLSIIQILPNLQPLNINCAILRSDGVRSGKVCSIRSPVEASALIYFVTLSMIYFCVLSLNCERIRRVSSSLYSFFANCMYRFSCSLFSLSTCINSSSSCFIDMP